jgi:hypothetical protein
MSALGQKQTYAVQKGTSALPPIAALIASFGMSALGESERYIQLGCLGDPRVDFAAKHPKINRFCKKRFGAALQGLALSLGIPVGGDHYDRDVRSNCFGFRQQFKAGHPRHVEI